jgi:hypothetical protein
LISIEKLWTATELVTAEGRRIANEFTADPHLLPMFHATLAAAAVLQCSSKMVGMNTAHYVTPTLLYAGACPQDNKAWTLQQLS